MLFPGTGALTAPPSHMLLAPSAPSDPGQRGLPGERAVLVGLDASIQSLLLIQRESGHRLSGGGFPKELSSGNYLSARQLSRATPETADTQHRLCCRRVRGCTHQPRGVCVKCLFVPAVMEHVGLGRSRSLPSPWFVAGMREYWVWKQTF